MMTPERLNLLSYGAFTQKNSMSGFEVEVKSKKQVTIMPESEYSHGTLPTLYMKRPSQLTYNLKDIKNKLQTLSSFHSSKTPIPSSLTQESNQFSKTPKRIL
jgi:hypothetical protein